MPSARRTAGEIMDRTAALMNDPSLTDYTYPVMMPFLNMAISELNEHLEEANHPSTNQVFPWGTLILPFQHTSMLNALPTDLVEIQEVGERKQLFPGDEQIEFRPLPRVEFATSMPRTDSLRFWAWKNGHLQFNEMGATIPLEIRIKYIKRAIGPVNGPDQEMGMPNVIPYLSYKTGALCALFIGENQTRAQVLNDQAEQALERIIAIGNKGNQQLTTTRHRPFRAAWKMRGY